MAMEQAPKDGPPVDPFAGRTFTVDHRGQPLTFRYDGRATPSRGRCLTDDEFRTACLLTDQVARLKAMSVPSGAPDISVGANAWAEMTTWHPLFGKDRRNFDHLRLFCQPFTGFDPINNRLGYSARTEIPTDIDDRLQRETDVFEGMVGLVADRRRVPEYARVRLPLVFGETGPVCDGILSSYDVWSLQAEMNGLYGSGILDRLRGQVLRDGRATVVEIGSAFGGLGYQLAYSLPPSAVRYVAVDLPDSLLFAAIYLSSLWSDRPTYLAVQGGYLSTRTWQTTTTLPDTFAALYVVAALADRVLRDLKPIDLVLNFRSMQEMSDAQVAHYGRLARETLGVGGLLYEQNDMSRASDRNVKAILEGIFPFGGGLPETDPPGLSSASVWSNQSIDLASPSPSA